MNSQPGLPIKDGTTINKQSARKIISVDFYNWVALSIVSGDVNMLMDF
jgi:hypothetical protein